MTPIRWLDWSFMSESRKMSPWVERAGGGYASKEKSIEHRAGTSGRDEGSPSISWTLTSEHPPALLYPPPSPSLSCFLKPGGSGEGGVCLYEGLRWEVILYPVLCLTPAASKSPRETTLVVQWLRFCLPMLGVQVPFLVGELRSHMFLGHKTKT